MNEPDILVVDDDPDHLELTVVALAECCPQERIATALDSEQALAWLFGRGPLPRLVILDFNLLPRSGLQVLRAIRANQRTASLPVLVHSTSTEKDDIAACYAHGANSYVPKATDFDELRRRMRRAYEFWVTVNHGPAPA